MSLLDDLRVTLGSVAVLAGDSIPPRHLSDRSATGGRVPLAVVRPRTVAQISAALRLCNDAGVAVVPQGGMTGLAGGGNPSGGDIILSLELLRGIEEIDTAAATMTVWAGTPLEVAQEAASEAGLFLALDLGARGSCQLGGNLSTNAGGIRVIRYGMAREQVLGLEAVLADGTVVTSLNKMLKNNAGYDLKQLFIGAEGTLGIITRAVLRLHPPPGAITTALCALDTYEDVVRLLRQAQGNLGGVVAFEAMWRDYVAYNCEALKLQLISGDHRFWVILESTCDGAAVEGFLAGCLETRLIADALVAQSHKEARDFWSVREGLSTEALPNVVVFDVSLPTARIGDFAEICRAALRQRWPGAYVFFYGHIGDSNLHISVSAAYGPGEDMHSVDQLVYGVLKGFGGSISAEHGIGTLKRPYLGQSRSPEELALMRKIKAALDPKGILNPGKVI
ncbi:MAG: FAD-binding oxidoreductase [Rhizobiales bacterium]|nr:FAD-binding oxidoreductase [Hyphomicrobiales bacterium]MBI3671872.1 FAD-binding oxidoreductase [Hyphomicrobiales bacterium]